MKRIFFALLLVLFLFPTRSYCYTGEVIKSFDTPGHFSTGLTFDGKNLWLADRKEDKLFCINPQNGQVIRSIKSPAYWPMGLAWDGKYLWSVDVKGGIPLAENYNGKIYKIDPKDGTILHTVTAPTSTPRGLTWDGKYLWCIDNHNDVVVQFDPKDGTTIKSFKSPAGHPQGLTWDGIYLWISDRIKDEIYMVDPNSGCVIIIAKTPGNYSRGLCFDGKNIWNVDYEDNKLYKLKVNDGENFVKTNECKSTVTYTHQTTNFGPGEIKTLDVHLAIPTNRVNQTIVGGINYLPKQIDIITDKWEQKTAHFHFDNIPAGGTEDVEMTVKVKTYDVRYFIFPDKVGSINDIPKGIKEKYLSDNAKYQINNPIIQNAVKKAVGDEKNPYWMARNIYNYLIANMYYEMVGGWNTAPAVLSRGNGSCSEYSFVYIAMCRAAGIPARYVGSIARRGDNASMDDVFHRWTEIYIPNYGWIPVDPSGGDSASPRNQASSFGSLSNRFLITTQSGGGSKTMSWTYNSNEFYTTEPKTNVNIEYFGDWNVDE